MRRKATAIWNGTVREGHGTISADSKAFTNLKYAFSTRFEDKPGTNPEELIAAAHAGCFSMALTSELGKVRLTPESIETLAILKMENLPAGWTVAEIHLEVKAVVPGADQETFHHAATNAKTGCPISRLLKTTITMTAHLTTDRTSSLP